MVEKRKKKSEAKNKKKEQDLKLNINSQSGRIDVSTKYVRISIGFNTVLF